MIFADLVANAAFDPDDYRGDHRENYGVTHRGVCACGVKIAPVSKINGVEVPICGYCRARVKTERERKENQQ